MQDELHNKLAHLKEYIKELDSVAIAFSSGVDSTFLLKVAHEILGDNVMAITVQSGSFPKRELNEAIAFCKKEGIRHKVCQVDEMKIEGFSQNPPNRCYLCKHALFEKIGVIAEKNEIAYVAEGSNMDDLGDYRPGLQAVAELGVKSPLREVGLTKTEIRELSKEMGLSTWEKPSFACLASRFVYGEIISKEKLIMVENAEQLLLEHGFRQFRVRMHGRMARIEVMPEEFLKLLQEEVREDIVKQFKQFGFTYVTMDLTGYRMGSMNETLDKKNENEAKKMEQKEMIDLLRQVASGTMDVEQAALKLKEEPFEDLGFAKIDHHRAMRQGVAEVIYGEGKTPEQIFRIAEAMKEKGQKAVLITRMNKESAIYMGERLELQYDEVSRIGFIGEAPIKDGDGKIVVATGGTSDIPVAEEAARTAETLGNEVVRLYDVGVAGVHRLLGHLDELMEARVIIAVAGMEGALASVIGGLVDCPVIAVPTSVGYGASFGGVSALLSMLNSCASGVSVVNIDNGFGAGFLASRINHIERRTKE